jgi:hypothetical protein
MPRTSPYKIELTDNERDRLGATARHYTSPYRDVIRAKIVLLAADGLRNDEIAARLDTPDRSFPSGANASTSSAWPASRSNHGPGGPRLPPGGCCGDQGAGV